MSASAKTLRRLRKLHGWAGIIVFPLVFIAGMTGFYLNHEKLFNGSGSEIPAGALVSPLERPLSSSDARRLASKIWPDESFRRPTAKKKNGVLYYQTKNQHGETLKILASTGAYSIKHNYSVDWYIRPHKPLAHELRWNRLMKRTHTGKIGGTIGGLLADLASLALVAFAITGTWLWLLQRRRRNRTC